MAERSLIFGRAPDCDVKVDDPYCSPKHCRITQDVAGCFWLEDLGSTNGTFIVRSGWPDDKVLLGMQIELRPGDMIRIGRTELPWEVDR